MDKDSIILKYEQVEMQAISSGISDLAESNRKQEEKLNELKAKMARAYKLAGAKIQPTTVHENNAACEATIPTAVAAPSTEMSYEALYQKASASLAERGIDVDSLDYHSLVSEAELREIEQQLNRPLPRREKWTKSDFIAVFIAAAIGSLADIVLSDRNNALTGTKSDFSKWLNGFHTHEGGAPIDYQGKNFGGGFHRGLSKGHDILRFIEGIMMFQNGQFEAIRYENGIAQRIIRTANQYGTPYEQLSIAEAIARYAKHMFADLFSTCSLPFPGSSFLVEADNRTLRKFAADMYQNGFNIKNIMTQGLSVVIIEVILRIYFSIQSVRQYKEKFELSEDYSNFDAVKHFFKQENKDKLDEMLLVAHTIVAAMNIGKVIINKAPWQINIGEIFSVVRYGVKVLSRILDRNSDYAKLMRSSKEIHEGWLALEQQICNSEQSIIMAEPTLSIV